MNGMIMGVAILDSYSDTKRPRSGDGKFKAKAKWDKNKPRKSALVATQVGGSTTEMKRKCEEALARKGLATKKRSFGDVRAIKPAHPIGRKDP